MYTLTTSASGSFWHIVYNEQVMYGAPKQGHGRATKSQMVEWVEELNAGL